MQNKETKNTFLWSTRRMKAINHTEFVLYFHHMKRKKQGDWKLDDKGKLSNRSLAEMIVCSLYYAKPRIISDEDFDRAIDIVEEELTVAQAIGEDYVSRQLDKRKGSQPKD